MFKGNTSIPFQFQGNGGLGSMSRQCHLDFPGSRVCTTVEVFQTVNPPLGGGWVQPVVETVPDGAGGILIVESFTNQVSSDTFSCLGWTVWQ